MVLFQNLRFLPLLFQDGRLPRTIECSSAGRKIPLHEIHITGRTEVLESSPEAGVPNRVRGWQDLRISALVDDRDSAVGDFLYGAFTNGKTERIGLVDPKGRKREFPGIIHALQYSGPISFGIQLEILSCKRGKR